jgi:hypothetical protein
MIGSPRLSYQEGDHVCTLFASPDEQLRAAVEYIRGGLARGERCLYVCCERDVDDFRSLLNNAGIAVEAEEARGSLVLLTKHDGHLKEGSFDPDRMITMLQTAVDEALQAGFKGLCAAGDMTWILDEAPGTERLAEYEARLNRFYESNHALGLCLYNLVRVEGPLLLSNPFFELPEMAVSRKAQPADVMRKVREIHSARS